MQSQLPRLVMIGDSSVGKTSLVYQMCKGKWEETRPTVATAFYILNGDPAKGQQDIQIWDTAGAERYRALNSVYYHNAMGGLLVFDLTNRKSFEALPSWHEEFVSLAQPGALLVLIGNKSDLADEIQVPFAEAEEWAKVHDIKFFYTSAKDNTNINELSEYVLNSMPKNVTFTAISLDQKNKKPQKNSEGCC